MVVKSIIVCGSIQPKNFPDTTSFGLQRMSYKALKWYDRLAISIGVAKVVHLLHIGVIPGCFRNQLKTNNILLDEHHILRPSDYGMSMIAEEIKYLEKLWKWAHSEQNPNGKAIASVVPQHWQSNIGLLMTNDVTSVKLDEVVPCIALSKNDSYVMFACGGKVSLFYMMTFKLAEELRVIVPNPNYAYASYFTFY
ncbi:hypothetical protein JHK82_027984 [Glycine max]|nr:hypothetical protein JHK82_027984 [Glycine max]